MKSWLAVELELWASGGIVAGAHVAYDVSLVPTQRQGTAQNQKLQ